MRRPAGKYNRKISIRNYVPSANSAGELVTDSATELCSRMAFAKSGVGSEIAEKFQQHAENITTFYLPYDSVAIQAEVEATIQYDGRVFRIAYVEDIDEAHEEIAIATVERV